MTSESLYYLSAFTTQPQAGNPAGVWVGDLLPDKPTMQKIAADVGFSETAFISPQTGFEREIRYFSPEGEVAFCGHATIASGVLLGEKHGNGLYQLNSSVGKIPVTVETINDQRIASLTSVEPSYTKASDELLDEVLKALNWNKEELDSSIPPARAYAGAWHLVLAAQSKTRLDNLDYDFDTLKATMLRENLTTIQLVWRDKKDLFHSRNPFPVGGIVEDPATGAAAAALGGYLRESSLLTAPKKIHIHQGDVMGRPSRLLVEIPESGGIIVSGTAVNI